jgi:hypothetical protein
MKGYNTISFLDVLRLGKEGVLKHTIDKENIFEHGFLSNQHNRNHYYIFFFLFASCP